MDDIGPTPTLRPNFSPTPRPNFSPVTAPPNSLPPTSLPTVSSVCGARERREWGTLLRADKQQYVRALRRLYEDGTMDSYARRHFNLNRQIHGSSNWLQFLVWHRAFIFEFEERVRSLGGEFRCFTLPYWNYDYSNRTHRNHERSVFGLDDAHLGRVDFAGARGGCISAAFDTVRHTLNANNNNLPTSEPPRCIERFPNYTTLDVLRCSTWMDVTGFENVGYEAFAVQFQFTHGHPHVGTSIPNSRGLFGTHNSPFDPLFMLHHANVDRVWHMWQDCRRNWLVPRYSGNPFVEGTSMPFSNFIDSARIIWQQPGRPATTHNVSYVRDQFQDREVYSDNFRRVLSTCQGNTLTFFTPSPIIGVDEGWASIKNIGGVPVSSIVSYAPRVQTLQCLQPAGTTFPNQLNGALAAYDDRTFRECLEQCAQLYFKPSGKSNCVCTLFTGNVTNEPAVGVPPALRPFSVFPANAGRTTVRDVNDYVPECTGPSNNYGLYDSPLSPVRRVCFEAQGQQRQPAPKTCQTPESTFPPLPESWLRMNNLTGNGDTCANFVPSQATLSLNCVTK